MAGRRRISTGSVGSDLTCRTRFPPLNEAAPIHGMRYGDTAGESLSVDIEVHQDQYQQQSQGSGGQVQEQQQ